MSIRLGQDGANGIGIDHLAPALDNWRTPAVAFTAGGGDHSAYDPQPDGRRYAACGDGVVEPVAEWIARRLAAVIAAGA